MTTQAATPDRAPEEATPQYSLAKILGIWAAAVVPMAILSWVVFPAVSPVIDRRYPLSEVPEAFRYLEEGHAKGKVVITVEPDK